MIPIVDAAATQRRLQDTRYVNTCHWIFREVVYSEWEAAADSSNLCCTGIPGSGKSILLSAVVDRLLCLPHSAEVKVVYHYCDYSDQRSVQANHVLGTILKQLLDASQGQKEMIAQMLQISGRCMDYFNVPAIKSLIFSAVKFYSRVFLILDGLDECEEATKSEVAQVLSQLSSLKGSVIKVFISWREEDRIRRFFERAPRIKLTAGAMISDIEYFIKGSVASRIANNELKIRNSTLEKEIIAKLSAKAQGM